MAAVLDRPPLILITALMLSSVGCSTCGPTEKQPANAPTTPEATSIRTPQVPTRYPAPRRLVAIADLHGDVDAARTALRLAGAIDDTDDWTGGDLVVVQTGDVLDRGDTERQILELFKRLKPQAEAAGGALITLVANHEIMNMEGDLSYSSPAGFATFTDLGGKLSGDPRFSKFPLLQRARAAAFSPGGPLSTYYSDHNVITVVGDSVFVHAGVLPEHASYGVEKINGEVRNWILGKSESLPEIMDGRESPIWTRRYSEDEEPSDDDCADLSTALGIIKAKRIVVGHSVQEEGINSACDGKIWRADVGMSSAYGGNPPQVLEIVWDAVRVVKAN